MVSGIYNSGFSVNVLLKNQFPLNPFEKSWLSTNLLTITQVAMNLFRANLFYANPFRVKCEPAPT
jgi:hypothetical protein